MFVYQELRREARTKISSFKFMENDVTSNKKPDYSQRCQCPCLCLQLLGSERGPVEQLAKSEQKKSC